MKQHAKTSLAALTRAAAVAALYVALTVTPPLSALAFGVVQVRVSEALCILPLLFPETAPGIILGCLFANFFSPNILPLDILLGTCATVLGVLSTLYLRRFSSGIIPLLAPLATVLANALIVPFIFYFAAQDAGFAAIYFPAFLSVGAGETIALYALGLPLYYLLNRYSKVHSYKEDNA